MGAFLEENGTLAKTPFPTPTPKHTWVSWVETYVWSGLEPESGVPALGSHGKPALIISTVLPASWPLTCICHADTWQYQGEGTAGREWEEGAREEGEKRVSGGQD